MWMESRYIFLIKISLKKLYWKYFMLCGKTTQYLNLQAS